MYHPGPKAISSSKIRLWYHKTVIMAWFPDGIVAENDVRCDNFLLSANDEKMTKNYYSFWRSKVDTITHSLRTKHIKRYVRSDSITSSTIWRLFFWKFVFFFFFPYSIFYSVLLQEFRCFILIFCWTHQHNAVQRRWRYTHDNNIKRYLFFLFKVLFIRLRIIEGTKYIFASYYMSRCENLKIIVPFVSKWFWCRTGSWRFLSIRMLVCIITYSIKRKKPYIQKDKKHFGSWQNRVSNLI